MNWLRVSGWLAIGWILLLTPLGQSYAATNSLPVFPGAQGFGAHTRAAYGGSIPPVVHRVTNLNDSGAGSLRAALEASEPRIVIFEISGTIALASQIWIGSPYVTIAGQTAPSPGITIRNFGIGIATHDVLVQHVRVRVGDTTAGDKDGICLYTDQSYNVVIDHVSVSWAIDGSIDIADGLGRTERNVTVSNSLMGEHLRNSVHTKGEHAWMMLITPHVQNLSVVNNVFAHNTTRSPLINGNTRVEIVNNVMYNVAAGFSRATHFQDLVGAGPFAASIVGNKYIAGADTATPAWAVGTRSTISNGSQLYMRDNILEGFQLFYNEAPFDPRVDTAPVSSGLIPHAGSNTEADVLANVGARPADRDPVDRRIVGDITARRGRIIDSQSEVGGWPALAVNVRRLTLPSDPHVVQSTGYTALEEWLHVLARTVEGVATADPTPATPAPPTNLRLEVN